MALLSGLAFEVCDLPRQSIADRADIDRHGKT